jgi:hypothetical protein
MLIHLVTTSFKPVKASCQCKSKLYPNFVTNELIGLCGVIRSRAPIHSAVQPRIISIPEEKDEDEGGDLDDSDRWSTMPLYGWSPYKATLKKPLAKDRPSPGGIGSRRIGPAVPSGYSRESSANAKFGSRLVTADSSLAASARPASRRNVNTPSRHPRTAVEGRSVTVTRPAWDGSRRTPASSQRSAVKYVTAAPSASPTRDTPSEDSGVGLYRQMMVNDSLLNNDQP